MRVLFLGSGALGLPTLRALATSSEYELRGVVTQPDRPGGRGLKLRATPVKELARELGLPVHQPANVNRALDALKAQEPDALVVAAYGQILSKHVIALPRLAPVNLHASLLPRYRGAAPVQWALIRGETETGVTTFIIDEGLDSGPLLLQRGLPIAADDTAGSLEAKLAELGAEVMLETLRGLREGTLTPRAQDEARATQAPKIGKEMGRIDWSKPAQELFNLIRALNPAPGAFTFCRGRRLKVHFSHAIDENGAIAIAMGERSRRAGEIVALGDEGPIVQTGEGHLELVEVQPAGKRAMSGLDYLNGYQIEIGEILGE